MTFGETRLYEEARRKREAKERREKNAIIREVGGWWLGIPGLIQGIFLLALLASPFIGLWGSWGIAWKVGLTGLIGVFVMYLIYQIIKKAIWEQMTEDEKTNS